MSPIDFFLDLINPDLSFLPKALLIAVMSSIVCRVIGTYVVLPIGNILVLALLITPAAAARLLTDRLGVMMLLAPVIGDQLTLTPVSGSPHITDPGVPSGNVDKPLMDFTPGVHIWGLDDDRLVLTGEFGTVSYTRTREE